MRWNNNPVDVSLGIKIFDPGAYRIKIETLKPFMSALKEGQEQTGGVRAICKVIGAPNPKDVGSTYIANLYQHNEGSRGFAKQFQCTAYGYPATKEGEEAFNAVAINLDWTVDTDANTLGEGWKRMEGREINVELGTQPRKDNPNELQQTAKYMAI